MKTAKELLAELVGKTIQGVSTKVEDGENDNTVNEQIIIFCTDGTTLFIEEGGAAGYMVLKVKNVVSTIYLPDSIKE